MLLRISLNSYCIDLENRWLHIQRIKNSWLSGLNLD